MSAGETQMSFTSADDVASQVRIGDTVLIRARVMEVKPGVGLTVKLASKTDHYTAAVRLDLVEAVLLPDAPDEPADGTFLPGVSSDGEPTIYRRDDAGCEDPDNVDGRRHVRRWYDYQGGEWVDWPTAARCGVDLSRRLVEQTAARPADADPPVVGPLGELATVLLDVLREYAPTLGRAVRSLRTRHVLGLDDNATARKLVKAALDDLVQRGLAEKKPPRNKDHADRWRATSQTP